MNRVWFCGYRDWALQIYEGVASVNDTAITLLDNEESFDKSSSLFKEGDLLLFVGWSWIVSKEITQKCKCACLHPSPLPKYRGGSPLQHQIINGEKDSAVTLFWMDEYVDKGPIVFTGSFSLSGSLDEIFSRIVSVGRVGINKLLNRHINNFYTPGIPQEESAKTYYKRRTPAMSEIKLEDFTNLSARTLYDKVRALQSPYPNAYVVCADGKKLYIEVAKNE